MTHDFPHSAADLSAGWLSTAMGRHVSGFTVQARYTGFIGETLRLTLDEMTVIAKFPTQNRQRRAYFAGMGMYEREVRFYDSIAPRIDIRTPHCYFCSVDSATGVGMLLLEDMAPARSGDRLKGCTVDEAECAIRAIGGLHTSWWGSPEIAGIDWLHRYDPRSLQRRFADVWETDDMPEPIRKISEQLATGITVLDVLWQPPVTLIHRDYQLDNVFFMEGQTAIIDWQLIAAGRGVFDVAMFLCWNTPPEFRRLHEMALLRMYHSLLLESGIRGYPFEQCLRDYRLSMLQCLVRVVSIMGSGTVEDARLITTLHTLLERTSAALVDLDSAAFLGSRSC